jgi:hypothetical protein
VYRVHQALQAFDWLTMDAIDAFVHNSSYLTKKALRSVQQNEIRHFHVQLNTNVSATLHAFVHSEFLKRYYHVKVILQHEGQVITAECVCKAQYVDTVLFNNKIDAVSDPS